MQEGRAAQDTTDAWLPDVAANAPLVAVMPKLAVAVWHVYTTRSSTGIWARGHLAGPGHRVAGQRRRHERAVHPVQPLEQRRAQALA